MKSAFVQCRITPGGASMVLKDLIDEQKIQQAKVFTIFSDSKYFITDHHKLEIITALPKVINQFFLRCSTHKIPLISRLFDYRNLMFFYPSLMKILSYKIKRYHPDHITISSFAIAKNLEQCRQLDNHQQKSSSEIIGHHQPKSSEIILYLHSPMQYIWTHYDEYNEKLTGFKGKLFHRIVPKLRKRDLKFTKFDKVYANSKYTAKVAEDLYGIKNIEIKYPRVNQKFFVPAVQEIPQEYYLYIGRLVNFVRETDKIIKLCNELKVPLIVMGSGPDEVYLKSIAGPSIIFIGRISDTDEKIKIIKNAKGLINLTKESYGIGTVEAMLLGVPVFGYGQGATPELVDSDCGVLVENKKHKTLVEGFTKFISTKRDRKMISKKMRETCLPSAGMKK